MTGRSVVRGARLGNKILLATVFVNSYYSGRKRKEVKQPSGRSGNMEIFLSGEKACRNTLSAYLMKIHSL